MRIGHSHNETIAVDWRKKKAAKTSDRGRSASQACESQFPGCRIRRHTGFRRLGSKLALGYEAAFRRGWVITACYPPAEVIKYLCRVA
jgi:hypothetical protein